MVSFGHHGGYGGTDMIEIPSQDEMDDETFLKHVTKRHPEITEGRNVAAYPNRAKGWISPYRALHRRMHHPPVPHDYDHYHEEA